MFEGLPYEELTSFVEVITSSVTIPIHLFPPRVSIHIETHEIPSLSVNKNLLLDRREEIDNISDKPQLLRYYNLEKIPSTLGRRRQRRGRRRRQTSEEGK
jgi:hypothetical protein